MSSSKDHQADREGSDTLDRLPNAEQAMIKPKFEERYRALLGDRYDEFMEYSLSYIRKGIRANTLKISVPELKKRLSSSWKLTPVPWCKEGFWVDHLGKGDDKRYDIGNVLEHVLGYFYVQEPASMIPPVVLDPKPGERVLDMCAAPGSKTSQIAMMMKNQGTLVANDVQGERLKPLGLNLQRMGVSNTISTLMQGGRFRTLSVKFDRVLVDAPCSGTGTIRRSLKTLKMWSPALVKKLVSQQKQLIVSGFESLKSGGVMVYSTCTEEPLENEGVVSYLLSVYPDASLEDISLDIKRSPAILEFDGEKFNPEVKKCLRIWPQDNDCEGFFVAKIKKA